MIITHVYVHVKPESIEAFREASLENARESVKEPGVIRFDVLQEREDPTRFVLVEIYRTEEDPKRHKETPHYQAWKDKVADMMAEPRKSVHYNAIFPEPSQWSKSHAV